MSTTTDVLSLFKYDPVADADSTFNITQALNNNWDKLDAAILLAIAAAGAYNPEESYAVGDYCTYKGKLHKCSTAIPTGETWTEAHWTTTTVAAEMQELSSQLSNKLSCQFDDRVQIPNGSNFATFLVGKPYGYYYVYGEDLVEGMPTTDRLLWFIWHVPSGVWAVTANTNRVWRAEFTNNYLFPWREVVFCDKPQEFDLPLAEGFSKHYCASYCKTQDGMVTVALWIVGSGAANVETTIATLPEGFRPTELFRAEGIFDNGTIPSQNQCGITVNEYGQIAVQAKSAWGYVSSIFTFRAAD